MSTGSRSERRPQGGWHLAPRDRQRQHDAALGARCPGRPQRQGDDRATWPNTSRSRSGSRRSTRPIGTGLRAGELLLIGGAQGTGKTTMALQMARNIASGGQANVLYICFEHDEPYLLNRLIAMESALAHLPAQDRRDQDPGRPQGDPRDVDGGGRRRAPQLANNPRLRPSLDRIARYGQNLFLLRGSQTASTIDNIRKLVQQHRELSGDRRLVVVRRLHAEGAADPGARERDRRRSPSSSTASRTSRCPRTCR